MSSSLSKQLLARINDEIASGSIAEEQPIDEIEVQFVRIPGFRANSTLMWAHEEQHLYYFNSYSERTGLSAYTCYDSTCRARIYIRKDETAFRRSSIPHDAAHGLHYETYKHMYCYNKLREKAVSVPASMLNIDIYNEVIKEYAFYYLLIVCVCVIHYDRIIHTLLSLSSAF